MSGLSYIICSAGDGTRLREIHPDTPKSLLHLNGKTLLERSLESLPLQKQDQLIFIHRLEKAQLSTAEHIIHTITAQTQASYKMVALDKLTRGQAETALHADRHLAHSRIAIYNTDTFFSSSDLSHALNAHDFAGIAPCFRSEGTQWSFFKTEGAGPFYKTLAVAEKLRISDWCSTGFYYFNNAEKLFAQIKRSLEQPLLTQELYVAPLYEQWLREGQDIRVVDCQDFKPMGTIDQVKQYWGVSRAELIEQNLK